MVRRKFKQKYESLNCLERTTTELNISWSNSSSDSEDNQNFKYRKKTKFNVRTSYFSQSKIWQKDEVPSTENINYEVNMSPIIGRSLPEDLSPTFNNNNCDELNKSPVIGKKKLKKKYRVKHTNVNKIHTSKTFYNKFNLLQTSDSKSVQFNISECSSSDNDDSDEFQPKMDSSKTELIESESLSDLSPRYSQQINIDCTSPNNSQSDSSILISQFSNTQESKTHIISQSLTQNIEELAFNFKNEDTQTNEPLFYYHKRQRKKKLKKGGLALQLQKALHKKRANTSIWDHEVYLNKINNEEDFLYLSATKVFLEFSALICECDFIGENSCLNKKCFVVFDSSLKHNPEHLQKFKIYKPYSVYTIDYLNMKLCCYFNICRVLFET